MEKYKLVIGLEVHIELSTKSKMFCSCSASHFGVEPNTNTCPTCLGLPGALPIANKKAIESTIAFGLALDCEVANFSKFDRKHYFYPDLPKAFQTSQYDLPFCRNGKWQMPNGKAIRITRIHLEEDTGKLVHRAIDGTKHSLIDFNRSGVPLMELVTEPDFKDIDDAIQFLKEIQKVVRYLGISDADMEKGSMRLEANVSVRNEEDEKNGILPNFKIELKNINSFRFLKKAVQAEYERQTRMLDEGVLIAQETRGFDEVKGTTFSQRGKEEAKDYRYFPEPDLPPFRFEMSQINKVRESIPELPWVKADRYKKAFGLSDNYTDVLTADPATALYFEEAVKVDKEGKLGAKTIATVIVNQKLNEKFQEPALLVKHLITLSKTDFADHVDVKSAVTKALEVNTKAVNDYENGNTNVIGFLIGQVQKELKGKGDVKLIQKLLTETLNKDKD